jgi:hypothetical protein
MVIKPDSVYFYHSGKYQTKKLILTKEFVYGFEMGFILVKTNRVIIENNHKTEFYRIKKIVKD